MNHTEIVERQGKERGGEMDERKVCFGVEEVELEGWWRSKWVFCMWCEYQQQR